MSAPSAVNWLTVGPEAAALLAHLHDQTFGDSLHDRWGEVDFAQILALPTTIAKIVLLPADDGVDKDAPAHPVGFVVFSQVLDECEILTLGVVPSQRRAGIGRHLLGAVIDRAGVNAVKSIFLEVREDNQAALHLYQRHGFILAGRRRDYYHLNDGQRLDAIVMRKNIA